MIVVTGGAGFIGSALVWAFNQSGEEKILVVDDLRCGSKWKNLTGLRYLDIVSRESFLQSIESEQDLGISSIVHMGACSSTTETDADYLLKNNYEYSKSLASYCLKRNIRFLYASSAATYGSGERGYSDTSDLCSLRPLNMYGYSKHLFDLWMLAQGGLEHAIGIKFFNVWGPNEIHKGEMRSMVVKAYEQIKATGRVKLFKSHRPDYEDGKQMRDFLYIKDAVRMVMELYHRKDLNGIFNLGYGRTLTWIDLISPIFQSLGLEPNIDFIPMPAELQGKYQYFTKAEMGKYESQGCQLFQTPHQDAIQDFVGNHLEKGAHLDFLTSN